MTARSDTEIAQRYLEAMSAEDYETAGVLLAADAEILSPEGRLSGADFLESMRGWTGLEHLDISRMETR